MNIFFLIMVFSILKGSKHFETYMQ